MPCAVICIPEGHQEKCAGQINILQKRNPGLKWAVTNKPLDAVSKANDMAATEPSKQCSLFIVHSKFFNITKDPFAATMFKSAQKGPIAVFGCGKESGCDKLGKKFHWYMGPDGEWDIAAATKNINKLLDGDFTEAGFHGKPLRPKSGMPGAGEIGAMGGMGGMQLSPSMSMGHGMGMMGPMGMSGTMGGMTGQMSGSLSSGNLTNFGVSGGMSGQMGSGGLASPGGMGMSGGSMGMNGGSMGMGGGAMGMSGGAMGMSGGALGMSGGALGMSGGAMGMSGGPMGMSGGGMTFGSGSQAPASVDVVSEAESMLSKGLPISDVVKMLAAEVKRLTEVVEGKH